MTDIEAGVGHSGVDDAHEAGFEAAREAVGVVEDAEILYVFASSEYDGEAVLAGVDGATDATVIGCTTGGEIVNAGSYTETVATLALGGDGIDASVGVGRYEEGFHEAGRRAAEEALEAHGDDRIPTDAVLRTDDGWRSFPTAAGTLYGTYDAPDPEIMRGLTDVVGNMTVAGGWAADDWKYDGSCRVFHGRDVLESAVLFAALDLDVRTGIGRKHGHQEPAHQFQVTATEGDAVLEFDGEPALDVYRDLFGPQVSSNQFRITAPFSVDVGGDEDRVLVPHTIDEETGSIAYTGGELLSEGTTVGIVEPDGESVIQGAEAAIDQALARAGDPDDVAAVLVNDCVCRWYFLSDTETRERELDVIRERVGEDVPIVGLYTAGEVAWPGMLEGTYDQTIVVQVLTNEPL